METTIVVALIGFVGSIVVAIISLLGVMHTNSKSNEKVESQLEKQQAVFETKLDNLTSEVKEHNNFARRMPVVEEQIVRINARLDKLEKRN